MNFCLNTLFQGRLCTKFGWNWLNGSWEEDFQILSIYFCYLVIISTWKWAWPFILINLNPLQPRILCFKVWLKLARWFLRRRWKCEKFTDRRQMDRWTTDNMRLEKLTWAFISVELKLNMLAASEHVVRERTTLDLYGVLQTLLGL